VDRHNLAAAREEVLPIEADSADEAGEPNTRPAGAVPI